VAQALLTDVDIPRLDPDRFRGSELTKRIHHLLHGKPGNGSSWLNAPERAFDTSPIPLRAAALVDHAGFGRLRSRGRIGPLRGVIGGLPVDDAATAIQPDPPGPAVSKVGTAAELPVVLAELGLTRSSPVLVVIGGADGLDETGLARLRPFFTEALATLAEALDVCVVDGGTDVGVMSLMGRARAELGGTFPLVGVAAEGTVMPAGTAPLEPNHSHVVLVPGTNWGDESTWLSDVARHLAGESPSLTILVNGGEIALGDVARSVEAGRPVMVLDGSGRSADTLAAALRAGGHDPGVKELAASGLVEAVALADGPPALARATAQLLVERVRPAAAVSDDGDWLQADFGSMIDELPLSRLQRRYLRSRWLDQLVWMEDRAGAAQRRYYLLRLVTIVGGVMVPALVTLDLKGTAGVAATAATWTVSLLVAISAAVEGFFRFGDRWRHYRRAAELLKIECWEFSQLTGNYRTFATHAAAHRHFAQRVEDVLRQDVEGFIATFARESPGKATGG
jgi:hypothetical protein